MNHPTPSDSKSLELIFEKAEAVFNNKFADATEEEDLCLSLGQLIIAEMPDSTDTPKTPANPSPYKISMATQAFLDQIANDPWSQFQDALDEPENNADLPKGWPGWMYKQGTSLKAKTQQDAHVQKHVHDEDALFTTVLPYPQFRGILKYFKSQQEAFDFADDLHADMPALPQRHPVYPYDIEVVEDADDDVGGDAGKEDQREEEEVDGGPGWADDHMNTHATIDANSSSSSSSRILSLEAYRRKLRAASASLSRLQGKEANEGPRCSRAEKNATIPPPLPPPPPILHEEPVRIFCVEQPCFNGGFYRSFVAASLPSLWGQFRTVPPHSRHWYEVIRDGRPCHMYLDLEYVPAFNPTLDGHDLVKQLIDALLEGLANRFPQYCGHLRRECVWELDSSTPEKFSRHLIVRIPGAAWVNNVAVGHFLKDLIELNGDAFYVVTPPSGGSTAPGKGCFVDLAVYTRNRHFRLAYCCKGGKAAVLRPIERGALSSAMPKQRPGDILLSTITTLVDPNAALLAVSPENHKPNQTTELKRVSRSGCGSIGVLRVVWKRDHDDAPIEACEMHKLEEQALIAVHKILHIARERANGMDVDIRSVTLCGVGGMVSYGISGPGARYCGIIGGYHKSNFTYYVLNMVTGQFAHKCYDPDCGGLHTWRPLPEELISSHSQEGMP